MRCPQYRDAHGEMDHPCEHIQFVDRGLIIEGKGIARQPAFSIFGALLALRQVRRLWCKFFVIGTLSL